MRSRRGPLPPTKKDYKDPQKWVDPHFTVFTDKEPFIGIGGGIKKAKATGPSTSSANPRPASSSSQAPVKKKRRNKRRKEVDVSSFQTWEGEVNPLDASTLAYLAPGSSHVVVLLPGSTLGCHLSLCLFFYLP